MKVFKYGLVLVVLTLLVVFIGWHSDVTVDSENGNVGIVFNYNDAGDSASAIGSTMGEVGGQAVDAVGSVTSSAVTAVEDMMEEKSDPVQ